MKILSIGNSFSQDGQTYLHGIAKSAGLDIECYNLYVPGCSLEMHYNNLIYKKESYLLEINGESTERYISIQSALEKFGEFDFVTTQQASHYSGLPDTYYPYINLLFNYVRKKQPNAKVMIQETWSYEVDSDHWAFPKYNSSQNEMYEKLRGAYYDAAVLINAGIIPVGDVIQHFRENIKEFDYKNGGISLCRDGFHLSKTFGRTIASCVWFEILTGINCVNCDFIPSECDNSTIPLFSYIKEEVHSYLQTHNH